MKLLNTPRHGETILKANYDKLLHIGGVFILTLWLSRWLSNSLALGITLALCIAKIAWNYKDRKYNPMGDCLANMIGLILWLLWEKI